MIHQKPEVVFPLHPFINLWIEAQYRAIDTESQLVDFIHKCIYEADHCDNKVKAKAYKEVGYTLYSIIVGKSYESILKI